MRLTWSNATCICNRISFLDIVLSESNLESLREEIDQIDSEIVKLLNLRVSKACDIGKIKQLKGVDPYDPAREEQVFTKLSSYSDGPLRKGSLTCCLS